jgi:hypothetical protein
MPTKYYRTEEVVVGYTQHYRCGCTCPPGKSWASGWLSADSARKDDRSWEGKQHFQLESKRLSCSKFLKHARTEERKANQQIEIPYADDDWGLHALRELAGKTDANVAAVMWCGATAQWYTGTSGQGLSADLLNRAAPAVIAAAIDKTTADLEADAYGWNCAEIACVREAYAHGRALPDLAGCKFFASRKGTGRSRALSACKTCRVWIKALKGKYGSWEGGRFLGLV